MDLDLPAPDALARRCAAMTTEGLLHVVRTNPAALSAAAEALDAAAMRELRGRLTPREYGALLDALA